MKTLLLSVSFLFLSIGLAFGQTKENTSSSRSNVQKNSSSEVSETKSSELKSSDETFSGNYMGYEDQIKKRLVVEEIPQNFPTPKTGQTREEYKETMLRWFKKNLNMVEEEYHSNLK